MLEVESVELVCKVNMRTVKHLQRISVASQPWEFLQVPPIAYQQVKWTLRI